MQVDQLLSRYDQKLMRLQSAVYDKNAALERIAAAKAADAAAGGDKGGDKGGFGLRFRRGARKADGGKDTAAAADPEAPPARTAAVGAAAKPPHGPPDGCCCGPCPASYGQLQGRVAGAEARITKLAAEVRALEAEVHAARGEALAQPIGNAYFALFSSSQVGWLVGWAGGG